MPRTRHPWIVWPLSPDSDPQRRRIVTTADGNTEVCGIVQNPDDAPLIAAAPDLLAACHAVVEVLEKHRTEIRLDRTKAIVEAAIAKAQGTT